MRGWWATIAAAMVVSACTGINPPLDESRKPVAGYLELIKMRRARFQSAAYLIDMRIKDSGRKFSVTTEVFISGDSTGFFGRAYLGRGAFKGAVIGDRATIYFPSENEYYDGSLAEIETADCDSPGEVLLYVLSLLSARKIPDTTGVVPCAANVLSYTDGRFSGTVKLKKNCYPRRESLIDMLCADSIALIYGSWGEEFPYFKLREISYDNRRQEFQVKGYIREQRYNLTLSPNRFAVEIPVSARRLESF